MPLMVAPGRILALGSCSTKPDYDFASGVTLAVSWLADGECAQVTIPDLCGKPVMRAEAVRRGQEITVTVQGGDGSWQTKALWDKDAVIRKEGNQAVIVLSEGK